MKCEGTLPANCITVHGRVEDLDSALKCDSALYIDVLEHIKDDAKEISDAAHHVATGGKIIVLVPAHQWLYTPFDKAIGHHRRYEIERLKSITPASLSPFRFLQIDSMGLFLSAANRILLKQKCPSHAQIQTWDRLVVPMSRLIDYICRYRLGKSIIAVWEKRGGR